MYPRLLFALLLISLSSLCAGEKGDFNPKSLFLLDESTHNYLIRGNLPQHNGEFCYDELKSQITNYLTEQGRPISPDFRLICVSFLNSFADKKDCKNESGWFALYPDKGYLWRYPLFGYTLNPHYIPGPLRKCLHSTDPDGLRFLIRHLKCMVDYDFGEDVVIYIHCRAGKDRTGEASACYLMQYKGFSYEQAMSLNRSIAKRELRLFSINAIRWHAYYLRDLCQINTIGVID